jgi:sugar phosphate isomerase/epimerase
MRMIVNRRATIAALLSVNAGSFLAKPARSKAPSQMGLQLYTVRALLEQDFEGTLARIAAIGYRQVEFAGLYGPSLQQTAAMLKRHGLSAPSAHVSYEQLERELPLAIRDANELGQKFIVCPFIDERRRRTLDDWKRVSHRFNEIGEQVRKAGLSFAYHNHDFEFRPIDGRIPYDVMLAETDPGLVKLEIDLYWATRGKRDPVAYFQEYPQRFPLVHVKDMARDGTITDVGSGTIDFKRILGQSALAGMVCWFVEHDNPRDPMRSIETSLRFVQQLDV